MPGTKCPTESKAWTTQPGRYCRTRCVLTESGAHPQMCMHVQSQALAHTTRHTPQNLVCTAEPCVHYTISCVSEEPGVYCRAKCVPYNGCASKSGLHCTSKCSQGSPGGSFRGPWLLEMKKKRQGPVQANGGWGQQEPLQPASLPLCFPSTYFLKWTSVHTAILYS